MPLPFGIESSKDHLHRVRKIIAARTKKLEEVDRVNGEIRVEEKDVGKPINDVFDVLTDVARELRAERAKFKEAEERRIELEDYKQSLESSFEAEVAKRVGHFHSRNEALLRSKDSELTTLRKNVGTLEADKRYLQEKHDRDLESIRNDYESQADQLKSKHGWDKQELERKAKLDLEAQQRANTSKLQRQNEKHREEMEHLQERLDLAKNSISSAVETERKRQKEYQLQKQQDFDMELAQTQSRAQRDLSALQAQINRSRQENRELQSQLSATIKQTEQEYEDKLTAHIIKHNNLQAETERAFKEEEEVIKAEMRSLREKFEHDKEDLNKKNRAALENQKEVHAKQVAKLKAESDEKTRLWEKDRDALMQRISEKEADFEKRKRQIEIEFQKKRSELEEKNVQDQALLRKDVESLNGALLTRDKFTPLTDQRLKSPFISLGKDIDLASRAKWKPDQSQWPTDLLSKLSSNQRRVRQQLAQDMLWTILFQGIFCSPFRIFGKEGKELEESWQEDFGTGNSEGIDTYAWPNPSLESERWRYRTTIRLQEAVTKPASKWDSSSEVKAEYNNWIQRVGKELIETLDKICQLDQATCKELEELPRKAAELWLDMITQRCRIKVVIPESNLKPLPERVKEAQEKGLELVEIPELRRFGDPKGNDLQKSEAISVGRTTKLSGR